MIIRISVWGLDTSEHLDTQYCPIHAHKHTLYCAAQSFTTDHITQLKVTLCLRMTKDNVVQCLCVCIACKQQTCALTSLHVCVNQGHPSCILTFPVSSTTLSLSFAILSRSEHLKDAVHWSLLDWRTNRAWYSRGKIKMCSLWRLSVVHWCVRALEQAALMEARLGGWELMSYTNLSLSLSLYIYIYIYIYIYRAANSHTLNLSLTHIDPLHTLTPHLLFLNLSNNALFSCIFPACFENILDSPLVL